jgi:iron(III) transport system substrate-binding protein
MIVPACRKTDPGPQVVLYTSCDDYLLRDIIPPFEKESGIKVLIVGDTEATKTTGLVQRVLDEKEHPKADVWWSNEPFGTIKLERSGSLAPYTSKAEKDIGSGWPTGLRGRDGLWYGFALRCRAIVYNTKKLTREEAPQRLQDLADPKWKGRIGMARPQFGTTRGQIGRIVAESGPKAFREWATALKANGLRLYDGNSSVVRAVAQGEIEVGLTDSDDVYSGQHEGWPVEQVWTPASHLKERGPGLVDSPPMVIPNTVAKVKGAPHDAEAGRLIDYLLSEGVERTLAASESRTRPVHPALVQEFSGKTPPVAEGDNFLEIHQHIAEALAIWDEVFGR